jgi:hypothetical protein
VIGTLGSSHWLSLVLGVFVLYLSSCSAAQDSLAQEDCRATTEDLEPAVRLNEFDLFLQYLGSTSRGRDSVDYPIASYQQVTQAMAKKAIVETQCSLRWIFLHPMWSRLLGEVRA